MLNRRRAFCMILAFSFLKTPFLTYPFDKDKVLEVVLQSIALHIAKQILEYLFFANKQKNHEELMEYNLATLEIEKKRQELEEKQFNASDSRKGRLKTYKMLHDAAKELGDPELERSALEAMRDVHYEMLAKKPLNGDYSLKKESDFNG